MKQLKYQKTLHDLQESQLLPFYIISGPQLYIRQRAVELLLKKAGFDDGDSVSLIKMFGDEVEPEQLEVALQSYSLFSEKQLILIKDARQLKKSCWSILDTIFDSMAETTIIIMEDEKFDRRNSVVKMVLELGGFIELPNLWDNEFQFWIKKYAHKLGYTITDEAAEFLYDSLEPDLMLYIGEFEKLKLFLEDKKSITLNDLTEIMKSTRSFNVFEFADALCSGNTRKSLRLLDQVFVYNESVPGVIVMLVRHLVVIFKIKLTKARDKMGRDELQQLGLTPYIYNKNKQQAAYLSIEDIQDLFEALLKADEYLKTGYQSDKMTLLVQKFLNVTGKSKAAVNA
ncbi:DNA polymerase III subunit delta [candidate division KSB1 bacterium]